MSFDDDAVDHIILPRVTAETTISKDRNHEMAHMSSDVDIERIYLDVVGGKKLDTDVRDVVLSAEFEDSIDQTPTFKITIHDPDWALLNSGALDTAIDVRVAPRRWYRLDAVEVDNDDITLTFITRNAAYLTYHKKRKVVSRSKVTRAQFIYSLVRSVKKVRIPFYCPQLDVRQPIAKLTESQRHSKDKKRKPGIPTSSEIRVQGVPADSSQRKNIEEVLQVGFEGVTINGKVRKASERVQVGAIMCITQESAARTSATAISQNGPQVGLFQQAKSTGWPATRNPTTDAIAFYKKFIPIVDSSAGGDMGELIDRVQGSGQPDLYNKWQDEASQTVGAFQGGGGLPSGDLAVAYEFDTRNGDHDENYLAATYRLAETVNWRAYWVRDALHFMSEEDLFKARARVALKRGEDGVEGFHGGWDRSKKANQITIDVRMDLWVCPVGTVVIWDEGGTFKGRWLVTNIRRPAFTDLGTIVLSQPMKEKKEPAHDMKTRQIGGGPFPDSGNIDGSPKEIIDTIVIPIAARYRMHSPGFSTVITADSVSAANSQHGATVDGNRSDHQGPPGVAWAADMSDGYTTPNEDKLADELAKTFGIPWTGSGLVTKTTKYNRFQLIYRTNRGGNHFNHVHFGVKKLADNPNSSNNIEDIQKRNKDVVKANP